MLSRSRITQRRRRTLFSTGLVLAAGLSAASAGVPQLPEMMDREPQLPTQPVERRLQARWKILWREALGGPEEDLRHETAAAIALAHQQGFLGVEDLSADLRKALARSQDPLVRLTIAAALAELDVREAAAQLFELVQSGDGAVALMLEPALSRWNYPPARQVWLQRLADSRNTPVQLLAAAVEGTRITGETRAVESLRRLASDRQVVPGIRLAAARALGELQSEGLVGDARRLAAGNSPRDVVDRLAAASLLFRHRSAESQQVQLQLAVDDQPAVAAIALRSLLLIDPELVRPLVPELRNSPDSTVRQLAARSLVERPAADILPTLGLMLDDPHPDVRDYIRRSLFELAQQPAYNAPIRELVTEVLQSASWRELEQAARLLGELDHKPAAPLLTRLLYSDRAEVHVSAAWTLGQLAVRETLADMHTFASSIADGFPVRPDTRSAPEKFLTESQDACLSHLFQAFGVLRYVETEPVLIKFVARRYDLGPRSRGAAIWALGHLHENDPQPALMTMLAERVADDGDIPAPEPPEVRTNAAISLGRMKAAPALVALRHVYGKNPPGERIREACGWAIEQITGEILPDPEPLLLSPPADFLKPADRGEP